MSTYVRTLAELNKILRERGVLGKSERLHWDRYAYYWYVSGGQYRTIDGMYCNRVYDMDAEEWAKELNQRRGDGIYRAPHKPSKQPTRDNQRRREYKAEWAVAGKWRGDGTRESMRVVRMLAWAEVTDFFDTVVSQIEVLKNSGLRCTKRGGNGKCYYKRSEHGIFLRAWGQTRLTILHEIAHAVHTLMYGRNFADHGPEYCNVLLSLVERFVGPEKRKELEAAMHTAKCKSTSELVKPIQFVERKQTPDAEIPDLFADVGIAASEQKKS